MNRRVFWFGLLIVMGCGGSSTGPDGNNDDNNGNPPPAGSVKVFGATVNGVTCTGPQTMVGIFFNRNLHITADCGQRTITIDVGNLTGPATITFGIGNQWGALAQVFGGGQQFSTGFGGTGTLTLTTATLFRITGTFSFTAYTVNGGGLGQPVVTVQSGTFDISNP